MTAGRVLVVDDEESFIDALVIGLSRSGFEVESAMDGFAAVERFHLTHPDLVLLDVMLPGQSGIEVCRQIRAVSDVPIIMVTARGSETDAVSGLEAGADDYVTKPYRMRELLARVGAQLRRREAADPSRPDGVERPLRIGAGEIELDSERHEVIYRGEPVALTRKEFSVLQLLMENLNTAVPREVLIGSVWGLDYVGDTKTLDVHIKRLRYKLELDPSAPRHIVTVRGVGYRFEHATDD